VRGDEFGPHEFQLVGEQVAGSRRISRQLAEIGVDHGQFGGDLLDRCPPDLGELRLCRGAWSRGGGLRKSVM
jgi:hypothetical protein